MSAAPDEAVPLLTQLLEEQQDLSAVDRFAQWDEDAATPLLAPVYEARLPTSREPGEGEQYAFRVDLDACSGCKACVTACHSRNGLDEDETWRRVGVLRGDAGGAPTQQTVTTACHHCEDPGCLAGCPVQAYEKDPATGIVRHLDDQCIGCKYCTMTCPYEVPQFDSSRGIVRKCDMCADRLVDGEAPACVQGCPNGAITIDIVRADTAPGELLPSATAGQAPPSHLTRPTTRYVTAGAEGLQAADGPAPTPKGAHWPLAILTVGIQLSVGLLSLAGLAAPWLEVTPRALWIGFALASGAAAQVAAVFHLGRPHLAFRAVLGLRTSWMSREIVVLGGYLFALAATFALHLWLAWGGSGPVPAPPAGVAPLASFAWVGAIALGWLGLFTQGMIYVATGRPFWSLARTAPRFAGSALLLGSAAAIALGAGVVPLTGLAFAAALAVAWWKRGADAALAGDPDPALRRSAILLEGPLARRDGLRRRALLAGAVLLGLAWLAAAGGLVMVSVPVALLGATAWLVAELLERHLYFRAEAMPSMPGL